MSFIVFTDKCNQKCIYCTATERAPLEEKKLKKRISEATGSVSITGGEPTLRKDVVELVRNLNEKPEINEIEMKTNGTTLSYFAFIKTLIEAGVNQFKVALPTHLNRIDDKITRTHGMFEKRIKGKENIIKLDGDVIVTMVLNQLNRDYIMDYMQFIEKGFKGIKLLEISFIKIMGGARNKPWLVPKISEIERDLIDCCDFSKKNNLNLVITGIPLCRMRNFEEYALDAIRFVAMKAAGNSRLYVERDKSRNCLECSLGDMCGGGLGKVTEKFMAWMNLFLLQPQ